MELSLNGVISDINKFIKEITILKDITCKKIAPVCLSLCDGFDIPECMLPPIAMDWIQYNAYDNNHIRNKLLSQIFKMASYSQSREATLTKKDESKERRKQIPSRINQKNDTRGYLKNK